MNLLDVQNRINHLMSLWVASVKGAGSMSHTDPHHVSETILVQLLPEVYDLPDLRNLNTEKANYPAIDLADDKARVAIQVTSTANNAKIKHTLTQFVEHELYDKYKHLIVYILVEKQKTYSGKGFEDIISGRFRFDKKKDIRDYRDLLAVIQDFQIERATRVLDILEANFRGGVRPSPPIQRPPRAQHFTGRDEQLEQLKADLRPGHIVTLVGPGGVGKTALAAEALWTLCPENQPPALFPDGIVLHSFYDAPQAAVALETIARAYGEDPQPTPTAAARRVLAIRTALVVLDGAENADDLDAVLSVAGRCGVLITSRRHQDVRGKGYDVEPLANPDAVRLLQQWASGRADDDTTAGRICTLVGALPLAVQLAGSYMAQRQQDAAEYLTWLKSTPLSALHFGERQHQGVDVLLERSVGQLDETARDSLAVAGLLAMAPFSCDAIAAALDLSTAETGRLLAEAVNYSLLRRPDQRYQVSHPLIHTYARHHLQPPGIALERLATFFTLMALEQTEAEPPIFVTLDAERPHLMSILDRCATDHRWREAYNLASALDHYLDLKGHWTDRLAAAETRLIAARDSTNPRVQAAALDTIARAHHRQARWDLAIRYYREDLRISERIGDMHRVAQTYNRMGLAYFRRGEWNEAIAIFRRAVEISEHHRNEEAIADAHNNLGIVFAEKGELDRSIGHYERSLKFYERSDDLQAKANRYLNLGIVYRRKGEFGRAIPLLEKSLAFFQDYGDIRGIASTLTIIGVVYTDLGKLDQAVEKQKQSLEIYERIGDVHGVSWSYNNLGLAHASMGDWDRATDMVERSLSAKLQLGDPIGIAHCWRNLGLFHEAQGHYDDAAEFLARAFVQYSQLGATPRFLETKSDLVRVLGSDSAADAFLANFPLSPTYNS